MMTFKIKANRVDENGSLVQAKSTSLVIDTSMAGRIDALNPVELLLSALAACLIKGIERVAETLELEYSSVEVSLEAKRPETEARIDEINYLINLGSTASPAKLELLHKNLMKFGTIYNTVKSGTRLSGEIRAI